MKVRYEITITSTDGTTKWFVKDAEKAKSAVARNKTYKETLSASYKRVELSDDAIVN